MATPHFWKQRRYAAFGVVCLSETYNYHQRYFLVGAFHRKTQTIVKTFFKTKGVTDFVSFIRIELTLNATLLPLALEIEVDLVFLRSFLHFSALCDFPEEKNLKNNFFQFFPHAGTLEENT